MRVTILGFFLLVLALNSCKNDDQKRQIENEKDAKKKEVIYTTINKGWVFYDTPINDVAQSTMGFWVQWRSFMEEIAQKPQKTIGAFQQKAKALSKKAIALNDNIPPQYSNPAIKSRISALITQVRLLDLYIHLDNIPEKKVVVLVSEINVQLASLQRQMDKIVEKSKIPKEEGESDLLKMKDTTRAIPDGLTMKNIPHVE
ncbi:hypothetical protein [Flavobacterium restrictum]|uniref:Uncharacterized protein n=1 Tax=Flavobacterium restrictum TaxID=2594428 RepID=A0A553E3M8_9FLAO|nr:hypothetical protein [Flavobacterium restrictum]TRX39503.1 hypothetical protein FNW21_09440 [Flavobacterium restrictum]